MVWWNKKKETDQSSSVPSQALVAQDPRKNVKTTSAATVTTNTAVQNSTIFNTNKQTVTYLSTRQTVTHTQKAHITEIVDRRTPSQAELEALFAQMRMGGGATTSTTTTTTSSTRSRPPSLNGVALRSTPTFKANSSGGPKRSSTLVKTEQTTVSQKNGRSVTQHVETQRVELKPKTQSNKWTPWKSTASSSTPESSSTTYVSPYAQKPLALGYVSPYASSTAAPKSFTTLSSSSTAAPTTSKVLTSTAVPKPYISLNSSTGALPKTKLSTYDAQGNFNVKPLSSIASSAPTLSKSKLKPARVYIFNHEKFDNQNEFRAGSAQDVKALCKAFEQLKCKVEIITNATVATVRTNVKKLETKNFSDHSALVLVLLTHGTRHDRLAAKDNDYSLDDDVLFPILRNRTLQNKPKLLFVQACKGAMEKGGFQTDSVQPHGSPNEILKCYSTYEGYVSYRTEDGTPFIQTLCEALQRYGKTQDIDAIMTDVRRVVKLQTKEGQIPSVTSTLTTKYVFGDYI